MEDLMVLRNSTASIYELPQSPIFNGQTQPATPQLDEVGSQTSKDVDLDAEGYIHHFRDSSPQKVVSSQGTGSNTNLICAPSDDVTNKPDLRRYAAINSPSSEPDAEYYTVCSNETFKDDRRSPAMTHPRLTKSSKDSLLNEYCSNNADSTVDYAAMRIMFRAPPDPTIWVNKMVTRLSTRPLSGDTEDCKASQCLSITDSHPPGPVHCTASGRSTPFNAHDNGDRNTPSRSDLTDARWANPLIEIPSMAFTSDAAGLSTRAWIDNHNEAAEDSDTSAVSGHRGTIDCRGSLSIYDDNYASRVGLNGIRGAYSFNTLDDFDRQEKIAPQEVGRTNRESSVKQCSRVSNSQGTEQDTLLVVSSELLFGVFPSMLT